MLLGFDRSSISHISKPLSAICEKAKAVDSAIPPNLRSIFLQSYANNKEKTRKAVCFFHFDFESRGEECCTSILQVQKVGLETEKL